MAHAKGKSKGCNFTGATLLDHIFNMLWDFLVYVKGQLEKGYLQLDQDMLFMRQQAHAQQTRGDSLQACRDGLQREVDRLNTENARLYKELSDLEGVIEEFEENARYRRDTSPERIV